MNEVTGSRIVVLDDELADLRLLERLLTRAGYDNVLVSSDPAWVGETFDPTKVDLLVLDLHMPEVDGFEMLKRIRAATPPEVYLPILVITADADTATRREALELGATDFLTKPLDVVEVMLRVRNLLETRKLQSDLATSNARLEEAVALRTEELATANALLQKEAREKDQFIAGVSHELRTPLTSVVGFATQLADNVETLTSDEVGEASRIVLDQAIEISAIVEDLLVAARFRHGSIQVLRQHVDIRTELEAVIRSLPADARSRISVPARTARAMADGLRVRQILRNLITNALRHGGPHVSVSVDAEPSIVRVTVADDGSGVQAMEQDRLFDPYYRGVGVPGLPASIGLGLTVSRQLARLMGGDVTLVVDTGTSAFCLGLPNAD